MTTYVFQTKKEATEFCKKKNKKARTYVWRYMNCHGGYIAIKQAKETNAQEQSIERHKNFLEVIKKRR